MDTQKSFIKMLLCFKSKPSLDKTLKAFLKSNKMAQRKALRKSQNNLMNTKENL